MRTRPAMIVVVALAAVAPGPGVGVEPAPPSTIALPSPSEHLDELLAAGALRALKQDWAGAEELARAAIAVDATVPDAWHQLAQALVRQDRGAEAASAWKRALELDPGHAEALEGLGRLEAARGAIDDAEALLERLRPIDDRRAATLHHAIELARESQ